MTNRALTRERPPRAAVFFPTGLPDQDRTWLAVGAQWQFSKQGAFDFGYAHLFVKDASSNLPNIDPNPPSGFRSSPRGNLVGNHSANVNILSAQVRMSF